MQSRRGEVGAPTSPAVLTVKEAAGRLKVSTATVYKLCESGRLKHLRLSTNCIRILEEALVEFLGG